MCAPAIGSDDAREEERKPLSRGERVGEWLDLRNPSRVPLYESVRWAVVGDFFLFCKVEATRGRLVYYIWGLEVVVDLAGLFAWRLGTDDFGVVKRRLMIYYCFV